MADLVSGRFGQLNPWWTLLGQPVNATQADIPARSDLEYLGISALTDTAAALTTQTITCVAIPVDPGTTVSKVSVVVGATAASTPTHSFACLYSGISAAAPALLKQSTDGTTAAIAASGRFDFTLSAPYVIQPGDAPYGYVWAGVSVTGTAVPSLITAGGTEATAAQYAWFTNTFGGSTNGPAALTFRFGSSIGATAPATITSVTAQTACPVVFLT
jgi:hypothetical protein